MIRDVHPGSGSRFLYRIMKPDPGCRGQRSTRSRGEKSTGSRICITVKMVPSRLQIQHEQYYNA
jgi:hypothetical protein